LKKEKTILFDLDGTLIDSTPAILESFKVTLSHFGSEIPSDKSIIQQIGHPLDIMFESIGVTPSKVDEHVARYKEHYRKVSKLGTSLLENAKDAVELASLHATLGVVTTKTGEYSKILLEHLGLMGYFEVLIGREDVIHPKPNPEPINKALSKLQKDKKECWMIGDTCMDIVAATQAGIESVAVTSGYASSNQLEECSSHICENALEAVKLIIKT